MKSSPSGLRSFLDKVGENRVLTREEEVSLFRKVVAGDEEARETVVKCNLRFVIHMAQQYRGRGMSLEDLVQDGSIGLLEAVGRYDYTLGYRFSTYAAFWIRQAMQVAVRQRGGLIRIPVRKCRQLGFMKEVVREYMSVHGRPPTEEELAARLKITPKQAGELGKLGDTVLSLDAPAEESGAPLLDVIPDTNSMRADERVRIEERRDRVKEALRYLTDRESKVIEQRFGFGTGEGRSLRKVSRRLGLSQEGVRRIEQRALAKLRRAHISRGISGLI